MIDVGLEVIARHLAKHILSGNLGRERKFGRGMKNLHPEARAAVEQSALAMVAITKSRHGVDTHIARLNGVMYESTETRYMPLVAGQMRQRRTVRTLSLNKP